MTEEKTKVCTSCNVEKDEDLFKFSRCWRRGKVYGTRCKECENALQRSKRLLRIAQGR